MFFLVRIYVGVEVDFSIASDIRPVCDLIYVKSLSKVASSHVES